MAVQIGKWGKSLAVRLPKELVEQYRVSEGDAVNRDLLEEMLRSVREERRQQAEQRMREIAVKLPPGYKFDREEANAP